MGFLAILLCDLHRGLLKSSIIYWNSVLVGRSFFLYKESLQKRKQFIYIFI